MIANCGTLGLDWRQTDLSDYLETLEAYNEAHDPDRGKEARGPSDRERVRRFHHARRKADRAAAGSAAAGKA